MTPRLLDLCCGAGGAAVGYYRTGLEVVGVDIAPQPRYPFEFFQDDVFPVLRALLSGAVMLPPWSEYYLEDFSAIHASPPCQLFSATTPEEARENHVDLITPIRPLLEATGLPYVIENVPGAPLIEPVTICGSSLGLKVRRHRSFETNFPLLVPSCAHGLQRSNPHRLRSGYEPADDAIVPVYGGGQAGFSIERCRAAMGIEWMTTDELNEAIPPAYTELIGHQLMQHLKATQETAQAVDSEEGGSSCP